MGAVKSFTVGTESYNVARATALQQDEALSLLTAPLIQRLIAAGQSGIDADEEVIFAMTLAMPFSLKQKLDELLMGRVTRQGTQMQVSIRDFDGHVMDYNRLRAKVLMWNLEGFFTYWASEKSAATQSVMPQAASETA